MRDCIAPKSSAMKKSTAEPTATLRLPDLRHEGYLGARLTKHAVSIGVGLLGILVAVAIGVTAVVRVSVKVTAPGVVEPVHLWSAQAEENGVVQGVLVHTGDTVHIGQVVVQLDTLSLHTRLAELEGRYRAAELEIRRAAGLGLPGRADGRGQNQGATAELVMAKANLLKLMAMYSLGSNMDSLLSMYRPGNNASLDLAVSDVQLAEAESRLAATQASLWTSVRRLEQAKARDDGNEFGAQIRETRERLAHMAVVARISGVVTTEDTEHLVGTAVHQGDTLLEISDLRSWRASFVISERDARAIRVGDSVRLDVTARSQGKRQQLEGHVIQIAKESLTGSIHKEGEHPLLVPSIGTSRVVVAVDSSRLMKRVLGEGWRGFPVQAQIVTYSGRIIQLLSKRLWGKLHL